MDKGPKIKRSKRLSLQGCIGLTIGLLVSTSPNAFELAGIQWPTPTATFYVDMAGANGLWNDSFENAMALWGNGTSFVYLINRGTFEHPCNANFRNGVDFTSDVCGTAYGSNTLAVTLLFFTGTTLSETDIVFNKSESWNVYSDPYNSGTWSGINDFGRVAVHELGHALGLDHEDDVPAIMATLQAVGNTITAPTADDIAGVNAIYGGGATTSLAAAVLPGERHTTVGRTVTAFATVINTGNTTAVSCGIFLDIPPTVWQYTYQTTDPATNIIIGTPNTPVDIVAGQAQTFVMAFTPNVTNSAGTTIEIDFDCSNTEPAPVIFGTNTLHLSSQTDLPPDVIAMAATPTGDGILRLPGLSGSAAFSVATVNVGSSLTLSDIVVDTGSLPLVATICQTNPATGICLTSPAASVQTSITAGASPTFAIFVTATGPVPLDPAANRIGIDIGGFGSTSVAVTTTP